MASIVQRRRCTADAFSRMIRPQTLLERLSADRTQVARSAQTDHHRLRLSIMANVRRVLATRVGSAAAQPELGTLSPSELVHDYPACIPRLQRSIAACIQRYEPRLAAVRIEHQPGTDDAMTIHFQISAMLADGSRTAITFETRFDDRGRLGLR